GCPRVATCPAHGLRAGSPPAGVRDVLEVVRLVDLPDIALHVALASGAHEEVVLALVHELVAVAHRLTAWVKPCLLEGAKAVVFTEEGLLTDVSRLQVHLGLALLRETLELDEVRDGDGGHDPADR